MPLPDLLLRNRSYRRFDQSCQIDRKTLVELVALTRLCPSGGNRQPLRFLIAETPEETQAVFPHLRWAAALRDWPGPVEGERPTAYIVILRDTRIVGNYEFDAGIAAQSMLLAATEQGLGGCMIGSIDRNALRAALRVPPEHEIVLVVALGKPAETVVLEDTQSPNETAYWRDPTGIHHVPKRPLAELLLANEPPNSIQPICLPGRLGCRP
jgi:nitroreductase